MGGQTVKMTNQAKRYQVTQDDMLKFKEMEGVETITEDTSLPKYYYSNINFVGPENITASLIKDLGGEGWKLFKNRGG